MSGASRATPAGAGGGAGGGGTSSGAQPRRRRWLTRVLPAGVLVLSLAGWGWFASEGARDGWWAFGQHVAVGPDDEGWASLDTVRVRLAGAETLSDIDGDRPPAGFAYLALDLEVEAGSNEQLSNCDVAVRDEQGRLFLAGEEVPGGDPYTSWLQCGSTDAASDPVPTKQSVLVLVPVDADLTSVRLTAIAFPPAEFIELPLPS